MSRKDEREEFGKKHPNVTAREMPNSYEAETALIGGMIIDSHVAVEYLPRLSDDDFYTPAHKHLYAAMNALFNATRPIDLVSVVQQLESDGTLELSGGVDYVSGLVNMLPSISNADYYFKLVKKNSQLRAMIEIARQMADEAYAYDPDDSALAHAEAALYGLAETGRRGKPELVNRFIDEALVDLRQRQENRDAYRGVPSGFPYLDTMLGGGFQRSDLIILAARPGQGKTSFAMNCAVNASLARRPDDKKPYAVAVFSLEMSAVQLAKRILCSVGNFDMSKANRANIDETGWAKLYGAQSRFGDTRLYIDESGSVTPAEILSKCRQLKHTVGLDFVMIDYLQLMHSGKNIDNIVREIAEITRALKLAAKELNVPFLVLSQLSRDIDKRKDPTPQLSDLRDSGAIEQDADIVLFLDRTAKTTDMESPDSAAPVQGNTVFLNIAKHRNGETGAVRLLWNPSTVTFKCVSNNAPDPARRSSGSSGQAFFESDDVPAPPDGGYSKSYDDGQADDDYGDDLADASGLMDDDDI